VFKKLFTASWMALLFTFCHLAAAATNVSVTATPSNPTAPATVTLAVSGVSDGNPIMVTKVEYFNGTTSLGVSVQSPFTLTLNNLAAGTYQISVKATTTDPANPVLQSAPLALTVGSAPGAATAYFIHTDQLNTPRAITDGSGKLVWQWDSDPFGKDTPNEQPTGQPAFTFNQRFPGQQFDRESNLNHNYFRDYDPALGRYIQSDPIGLDGGINTYGYVEGNSLSYVDSLGLYAKVVVRGNRVEITIPIEYTGPGATKEVVNRFNRGIRQNWSGNIGRYKVRVRTPKPANDCPPDKKNVIDVPQGNGRAYVNGVGGNTGVWPSQRPAWTAGHEAGHLMGLPDEYTDSNGPNPGYENSIMGARDQRPTETDIGNVIRENR